MNARLLIVPVIVGVAAIAIWKSASPAVPAATWRIGTGADVQQGKNYDDLPGESPLRLSFFCDEARYAYVFSHSTEDGTLLLFPSPDVRSDLSNPLSTGTSVLPGKFEDKELCWTTRSGVLSTTTFVVIAAREPVPELEALLPKLRRWTNSVMPDRGMLVTKPRDIEVLGAPRAALPTALLQRAADWSFTATMVNGPMQADSVGQDVWFSSWRVHEVKTPASTTPSTPMLPLPPTLPGK